MREPLRAMWEASTPEERARLLAYIHAAATEGRLEVSIGAPVIHPGDHCPKCDAEVLDVIEQAIQYATSWGQVERTTIGMGTSADRDQHIIGHVLACCGAPVNLGTDFTVQY